MSRDGAKAKAYAKERGIKKWYDDAQELIDDPEVNAIYTVSYTHLCNLCVVACPLDVIALNKEVNMKGYNYAWQVKEDTCNGCSSCARCV